jgi:P63C domain
MSPDKTKQELDSAQIKQLLKHQREQKRRADLETAKLIFFKTEAQIEDRDANKEPVFIEFQNGRKTTFAEIQELNSLLLKQAKTYEKTYPPVYYDELRRLTGLKKSKEYPHHNPSIFAVYTLQFIYRRFALKELIAALQERNPYITGYFFRRHKHFQFLNEEGQKQLEQFICEAVEVMTTCSKMHEFKVKYCQKYNLVIDRDMFIPLE